MLRFLLLAESSSPAEARVLSASVRAHHPEAHVTWLDCDPRPLADLPAEAGDDLRYALDESIGDLRYVDLTVGMSPAAARWGVIPGVVASLLSSGDDETVVVLPSSAQIFGPLDELISRADGRALLLPRRFDPAAGVASEGWLADTGVFGPRSRALLGWWSAEAERWARDPDLDEEDRVDPWRRFLGQSVDVVAGGAGRFRVAPATVADLRIDPGVGDGGMLVDGRSVVIAQFPRFDPDRPWWYVTPGADRPEVSLGDVPALRQRCRERARELIDAGWERRGHATALAGWQPGPAVAAAYRAALAGEGACPANPYVAGEVASFVDWVTAGPAGAPRRVRSATAISPVADDVWASRPDLAAVFPQVAGRDRRPFVRWMWTSGLAEGDAPLALLPEPPRPVPAAAARSGPEQFGVNLVGYHGAELGLGVAIEGVARALDAAEIPWCEVVYTRTSSRQRQPAASAAPRYHFNLILVTPDQLPLFVGDVGPGFLTDRYTIGLWYWETDVMTPRQLPSFGLVDEVWGATDYLARVFAAHTAKPVRHVPVPLEFPATPPRSEARALVGLDDRFTFLFSMDFLSVAQRKNPLGLVEAYRRAFPEPGSTRLVVKSINGDLFPEEREELRDAVAERPDVELWDRYLSAEERLALIAAADCYVSLHRSEGLGLTMAEAMAAGTPVIATRYSGNLDFMDDQSALLVDATEIEIGEGSYYPAQGHWADPDLDQAAAHMRRIAADSGLRDRLVRAGHDAVAQFSTARVADVMSRRLVELWRDC